MLANLYKKLKILPRRTALFGIRLYQHTISPDHGIARRVYPYGFCKFYPSCSQYSYEAVEKYGLMFGLFKTTWRILRCNPWSGGGVDKP